MTRDSFRFVFRFRRGHEESLLYIGDADQRERLRREDQDDHCQYDRLTRVQTVAWILQSYAGQAVQSFRERSRQFQARPVRSHLKQSKSVVAFLTTIQDKLALAFSCHRCAYGGMITNKLDLDRRKNLISELIETNGFLYMLPYRLSLLVYNQPPCLSRATHNSGG
jgi:hypothetical protein